MFIPLKSKNSEKFKYLLPFRFGEYFNSRYIKLRTIINKSIQIPKRMIGNIDIKSIKKDVSVWLVEAFIEGFLINFIVWALIDWKFNLITIIAWGFVVKQFLSIYWRLRKDGSNTTVYKDK